MMAKRMVITFVIGCLLMISSSVSATSIPWMTSYTEGVKKAKAENKPLLVFFTGSDWCGWCQKLESEALDTAEFGKSAQDKFIFVKLDFPAKSKLSPSETQENKELQKRFAVRGFPTIVVLTPNEEQIGVTGYRAGGGVEYANHLLKMVQEYSRLKEKVSALKTRAHSASELKALYALAEQFQAFEEAKQIAYAGFDTEEADYFRLERLRDLYGQGQEETEEAKELKNKLQGTLLNDYHLALLEFGKLYQAYRLESQEANRVIAPLKAYLATWGKEDKENSWRLEMMISQVCFEKKEFSSALIHAKESMLHAPKEVQEEIALHIKDLQKEINP
jgi:protein disulfide-isomerase